MKETGPAVVVGTDCTVEDDAFFEVAYEFVCVEDEPCRLVLFSCEEDELCRVVDKFCEVAYGFKDVIDVLNEVVDFDSELEELVFNDVADIIILFTPPTLFKC